MASHFHSHDPSPNDIARGYEGNDITVRGFVVFVAAFIVSAAVIHTIVWFVLVGMQDRSQAENTARFPPPLLSDSTMAVVSRAPPPNLQPSREHPRVAWRDMDALRDEQEESLTKRGWDRTYTSEVREPSQPLNQLRLPGDAADAVGPRVSASRSGGPSTQPTTERAAAASTPRTEGTRE